MMQLHEMYKVTRNLVFPQSVTNFIAIHIKVVARAGAGVVTLRGFDSRWCRLDFLYFNPCGPL